MVKKILRFWKIVVFDAVGVGFLILALLTGWLPGPGGVPLFIIGLSILAIHHDWANRYIELLKKYGEKIGDIIFVDNKYVQFGYDVLAPLLIGLGVFVLFNLPSKLFITPASALIAIGIIVFLGNRKRWQRIKDRFKHPA